MANDDTKFKKLSADKPENTKIMAGHASFTIQQMEGEIDSGTEIGKKLKSIEKELEKY